MAQPFPQQIQIGGPPDAGGAPAPGGDAGGQGDPESQIRDAIDQIRAAVSADGLDEQERLILEQITTLGQKLLAGREKQAQAALGGGPATQFIKRAVGG